MSARDDYPDLDNLGRHDDALDEIDRLREEIDRLKMAFDAIEERT